MPIDLTISAALTLGEKDMAFTASYTDAYGMTHTDAVFEVRTANLNSNHTSDYVYNPKDQITELDQESFNGYLSYQVVYWRDQASKDAGHYPYTAINEENYSPDFTVDTLDKTIYDGLTAHQAAEYHFKTVILGVPA